MLLGGWTLVEIIVLVQASSQIGLPLVVLEVVATAVFGVAQIRRQGLGVLQRIPWVSPHSLMNHALHGGLLALGGALLIVPGMVSDVMGLSLIVPWVRHYVGRWVIAGVTSFFSLARKNTGNLYEHLDEEDIARAPNSAPPRKKL